MHVLDTFYFILAFVFIFGFWLWDGYQILAFWGVVENAKTWSVKKGELVGVSSSELVKGSSKNGIFSKLFRLLFSRRRYNIFVKMDVDGVDIGVFNASLYPKYTRLITVFCRSLERKSISEVDVYYNPDDPHEATIIPPSEHKVVRRCVWFGIKTFVLTLLLLYFFV